MIPAPEALLRLREGNARFAADDLHHGPHHYRAMRRLLVAGQDPFAIVVGCSDSRVPVEIIFDQGLGELFVIRVAGNVMSCTQMGSIEFAAVNLGGDADATGAMVGQLAGAHYGASGIPAA